MSRWQRHSSSGRPFEPGLHRLLAGLATAMDFVAGVFWVSEGDVLVPRAPWHDGLVERPLFEAATRRARLPRGIGLPGSVRTSGDGDIELSARLMRSLNGI